MNAATFDAPPAAAAVIRIVVVDDHPTIIWGLEQLLGTEAQRMRMVGSATNVGDARRVITAMTPDIVLLDLDLAGISACGLISECQRGSTRFVVFSGQRDAAVLDAAMLAGARGVIEKSTRPDLILRAIERVHAGEIWLDRTHTGAYVEQLRRKTAPPVIDPFAVLTAREREIVRVTHAHGAESIRELADRLFITDSSLRNALSAIYGKLELGSRLQLHALCNRHADLL